MKSQEVPVFQAQPNNTNQWSYPAHDNFYQHLLTNVIIYSSQYYPQSENFLNQVLESFIQKRKEGEIMRVLHRLHRAFEQEVIYGPSSSYFPPEHIPISYKEDVSLLYRPKDSIEEAVKGLIECIQKLQIGQLIPHRDICKLLWYDFKLLASQSFKSYNCNVRAVLKTLQLEGESWLESTPLSHLFVILEKAYERIHQHFTNKQVPKISQSYSYEEQIECRLGRVRLLFLHNRILRNPVKQLAEKVLQSYPQIIQLYQVSKQATLNKYVELLIEYSGALLFYYKYKQVENILEYCCSALKVHMEYTGKLGRRTKYQSFDTAQLIMNLKSQKTSTNTEKSQKEEEYEQGEEKMKFVPAKQLVEEELKVVGEGASQGHHLRSLEREGYEEDSILMQKPKFAQESGLAQETQNIKQLSNSQVLTLLALLNYTYKTTPHDQMLYLNIEASISSILDNRKDYPYLIDFYTLLLRSLNEFPRIKHAERALGQLQRLKNYYNQKPLSQKLMVSEYVYSVPYETYLTYIMIMAGKYIQIGLSISAVELYQAVGLYEECIDGLIQKNYKEKAEELINKIISERGKNPRVLCMLADIRNGDINYYEEAWELSNKTCARAQRSIGWMHFGKQDYPKAIIAFEKATQAAYYHPNTWFTLGSSYLRSNDYKKALRAFSESISIDETQGDAWGNMAACYMYMKKTKEAYSTLEQAVRYSEGNWKMWANFLGVALSMKQFYKYFECIERIVKLEHQEVLSEEIFKKVAMVLRFKVASAERRRILFNYKNRIDRLFATLESHAGQNPLVWRGKTMYNIELLDYYKVMRTHYEELHIKGQVDVNDLVDGYETVESTKMNSEQKIRETTRLVVESKQNQLNMTMQIGWEQKKNLCIQVKEILIEYIEIYKTYSEKHDIVEARVFVQGLRQKIEHTLECQNPELAI